MSTPAKAEASARAWARAFALLLVASLVALAANLALSELAPGNLWGLTYGTLAALLMLVAGLYGMRRRSMKLVSKLGLGRAATWLRLHLYGGGLFLLLMLMHSGFRLPSGPVTWWLWGLAWWTVLTGWLGLALQRWIPRTLASGLSLEVLYERIPELVDELREQATQLAATCPEPVQATFEQRMAPELEAPRRRLVYFFDITGGKQAQLREFDYLRQFLSSEEKEKLSQLVALYKSKLDVDAHYTLQGALRGWLWAHVPATLVLFAFLILHLFSVFYY